MLPKCQFYVAKIFDQEFLIKIFISSHNYIAIRFRKKSISAPGRPQRIIFQICATDTIQVNWGEPPDTNGKIEGYQVDYRATNSTKTNTIYLRGQYKRSITICKLQEGIEYRYNVTAVNEWGIGETQTATMWIDPEGYYESPRSSMYCGTMETPYQSLVDLRDYQKPKTSFFRTAHFVPQIGEYGNLYSLCNPGNQDYQKNFSPKKVEIDNVKYVVLLALVVIINESWYNQAYIFFIIELRSLISPFFDQTIKKINNFRIMLVSWDTKWI